MINDHSLKEKWPQGGGLYSEGCGGLEGYRPLELLQLESEFEKKAATHSLCCIQVCQTEISLTSVNSWVQKKLIILVFSKYIKKKQKTTNPYTK